ncbi:unnamed protein product [Urochloa humidicola]
MDGGSGLNIIYADTLKDMGIDQVRLRPTSTPIHGIVPGKQAVPIEQIDLPITFGTPSNFRTEVITFEVVDFHGAYQAVLGRPCYAKYMAILNYTYLKLKMPGPKGVITVGASFQDVCVCDTEFAELATVTPATEEFAEVRAGSAEVAPDSNEKLGALDPSEAVRDTKPVRLSLECTPKEAACIIKSPTPK